MNYGKIFAKIRKSRHVSQQNVSKRVIAQSILSRFENNGNIDAKVLMSLLYKLHVHPTEFFMLAEDKQFVDEQNFINRSHSAFYNSSDNLLLVTEERLKFDETDDMFYLMNAVRIEATYAFKHGQDYSHLKTDITAIKQYLMELDYWFISEISIYSDLLFLFDSAFIKAQHPRMVRSLALLPFGTSQRSYLQSAYSHNATVVSFEHDKLEDTALYLAYFESTLTKDSRSLTNAIYYSAYQQLWSLKNNFSQKNLENLFQNIYILKQYGYDEEYRELKKFIVKILYS
ncbi:hypothetical protein WFA24289_01858 [Periweissella fabaria]|uniref:HTH-type transcriptional regulator Rgg C-terminal domain-containing protein n=1 Tax=Periweissella fabaria TaxID=546157 RepID=A0ABN8BIC8_9LACO|nr:helix-turn-helix transcriptional regulator [Periweissella fabaria]CAH0417516.1 hypothetical protein WFA24289_01858 [Periweissella fabaria]